LDSSRPDFLLRVVSFAGTHPRLAENLERLVQASARGLVQEIRVQETELDVASMQRAGFTARCTRNGGATAA
jgi:hypothetical protein